MGSAPQSMPRQPVTEQIVTVERLRNYQPVDASSFSGVANPSSVWTALISNTQPAAMKFMRDIEEKDAVAAALLEIRKDGVLRRKHQVVAPSETPEDAARTDFVIEALKRIPNFSQRLEDLLDGPGYGLSIAEILWEEADGQIWVKDIIPVPQEFFRFGPRYDRAQAGPLRFVGEWQTLDELVPEHKFLVFSFRPRNGNRWGRPLLRACFWDSWAARQITKFMLQHAEKGTGTVAVRYPEGAQDKDRAAALEAAEAIYDEPAVAISANLQIETALLEKARTGSVPDYLQRLEHLYGKITRRILGQTLTTQGSEQGAGSRALGEVHRDTFFDKVVSDAERLEGVVNDQLIRWLLLFNFGPGASAPKWEIDKAEPVDLEVRSRIDRLLVELGVPVPLSYAKKMYAIPEAQPGDQTLRTAMVPVELLPGEQP